MEVIGKSNDTHIHTMCSVAACWRNVRTCSVTLTA